MHAFPVPGAAGALCYHDFPGALPAVVFLHGLGVASSEAYPVLARHPLLVAHRVLLVDLLGFGYADRPADFSYTMEAHADSVGALLDHLSLPGACVVGHSMGGSVAILLAARRPDLAAALVVAEGNLDPGKGSASVRIAAQSEEEYVRAGHARFSEAIGAQVAATPARGGVYRSFRDAAPTAVYRSARSLLADRHPTFRQTLEGLAMPRAYLVGAHSLPDFPEGPVPGNGVEVVVIPDAGHGMHNDNPDAFAQAIARLIPGRE